MIVLERRIAWLFRTALRRCFDKPTQRTDQTPVHFRLDKDGLRMHALGEEIAVCYSQAAPPGKAAFAFAAAHLAEFEGRTADRVELTLVRPDQAAVRWSERGRDREIQIPLLEPESAPALPELPSEFAPLPPHFLPALHDACRATAQEPTQYVVNRVQLRGKTGTIVASDTRQLLVQGGYRFPFQQDLLIPRCGVFGLQPLLALEDVSIGRTETHVAIRVGPWAFAFQIDAEGRFPEANSIIPTSTRAATHFRLHPEDAQRFLDNLVRRLKGPAAKDHVLTLDLTGTPCLRFEMDGRVVETALPSSQVRGTPVVIALKLQQFLRALELRFQEFEIRSPSKPIVTRDGDRLFMAMPVSSPATATAPARPPEAAPEPVPEQAPVLATAKPSSSELVPVASGVAEPVSTLVIPSCPGLTRATFDLLGEAEGLKDGLLKVATHAGRILGFLRDVCARPNLIQTVRDSLLPLLDRSNTKEKSS